MEPIPATHEAVEEFGPFSYRGGDLLQLLAALSEQVEHEVPDCVGLSLSLDELGVTFTLVASDKNVATLDAVQYVDGGPGVEAVQEGAVRTFRPDRHRAGTSEQWDLFAQATTTVGVHSTLSLPIVLGGQVSGGFNLYASTEDAFDGRHDLLSAILGTWAAGAVADDDLGFSSREAARRAPEVLRVQTRIIVAAHLLASSSRLSATEAEERLRDAAVRAGVALASVVDLVIDVLGPE